MLVPRWAEFASCGDDCERGTVDALGLIEVREARARGAMVQSLTPARTWLESRPGMDAGMMPDSSTTDVMAEAYVRIVAAE